MELNNTCFTLLLKSIFRFSTSSRTISGVNTQLWNKYVSFSIKSFALCLGVALSVTSDGQFNDFW